MTAVVAMFENTRDADKAVDDLTAMGYDKDAVGVMAKKEVLQQGKKEGHDLGSDAGVGAVSGTAVGGITGLLVGVGALAIPGLGPIIAAGTFGTIIGATAVGAGIGAAAGGIVGSLTGMGLSKDESHFYAEGVKRGNILVTVQARPEQVQQVSDTMRSDNAVDVNTRRQEWQDQGWTQFDETADSAHTLPSTHGTPPASTY
ncbi:MAG: hypothetical protein H0U76_00295 [Ktedonobacteraceae bacterium]|nr:hypothetical protein [Ktedonobacteraceae bacterium]